MSLCVLCGARLAEDASLCAHTIAHPKNGWAADNMCDLLHRGIVLPGANATESDGELQGCRMAEAA